MEEHTHLPEEAKGRRDWAGGLRSLVFPLAVLAVIVLGLWYWDNRDDASNLTTEDGTRLGVVELPVGKNPTDREPVAEVGRVGPDFLLETPQGGTLRLSDLQGQPVVINFWATWCPPCRVEIPELVAAYERYRDQGLVIVAVDLQEPDDKVLKFADEFGMIFPIVIDRSGDVADVWRLGGPVAGIPTSYFIDEMGVIQDFFFGPMTEEFLAERLAKILPEGID